jgi:uncharacterized membrane protein YvbJ
MPIEETKECTYCGASVPISHEKCTKCGKYTTEDPEEYQKHLDNLSNTLDIMG